MERRFFAVLDKKALFTFIKQIVEKSKELKDKYTDETDAKVNYACIFSQSDSEYEQLCGLMSELGKVVEDHGSGPLFHIPAIKTVAGDLELVRIRKPDDQHKDWGDADFTVKNYDSFKEKFLDKAGFSLIERKDFEMIELMENEFPVRAYFSNPPIGEVLGVI